MCSHSSILPYPSLLAPGKSGTSGRSIASVCPQQLHFSAGTLMLTINSNKGLSETELKRWPTSTAVWRRLINILCPGSLQINHLICLNFAGLFIARRYGLCEPQCAWLCYLHARPVMLLLYHSLWLMCWIRHNRMCACLTLMSVCGNGLMI